MKTTNYLFVAFGAAALTLTACNNDDDVLNGGQEPGVVNIVTSINGPQTRVVMNENGSGSFEDSKDKLKLAVYGSGNADYQVDYTVGTTVLYWEDVEAGAGIGPYTFGGWFTKTDLPATLTSFNAATASDPDLLLAAPATNVSKGETVNLNFKHAMHKLVVKVTYEGDFTGVNTDNVSIKPVGMNASAAINVQTGIVTPGEATDTDGDYAAQTLTSNSCSFILAPQKLTKGAEWLQFSIPDVATLVYKVPANYQNASGTSTDLTELSSGQILTLNMKIKRDAATQKTEVELATGEISAWGTQGSINDELTIPAN
jgi:hypothetical protein